MANCRADTFEFANCVSPAFIDDFGVGGTQAVFDAGVLSANCPSLTDPTGISAKQNPKPGRSHLGAIIRIETLEAANLLHSNGNPLAVHFTNEKSAYPVTKYGKRETLGHATQSMSAQYEDGGNSYGKRRWPVRIGQGEHRTGNPTTHTRYSPEATGDGFETFTIDSQAIDMPLIPIIHFPSYIQVGILARPTTPAVLASATVSQSNAGLAAPNFELSQYCTNRLSQLFVWAQDMKNDVRVQFHT